MRYTVELIGGGVVFSGIVLLLIVPWFAAIAVVVATIAVLVGLAALAVAALVSPYLLVRSVCRRLCSTKNTLDRLAARAHGADRRPVQLRVVGRAPVTA